MKKEKNIYQNNGQSWPTLAWKGVSYIHSSVNLGCAPSQLKSKPFVNVQICYESHELYYVVNNLYTMDLKKITVLMLDINL